MQATSQSIMLQNEKVELHRINNDVNGNPRFVIHWVDVPGAANYQDAVYRMKKISAKKYRAKWYGGGIVFTSYSPEAELNKLFKRVTLLD